MQQQGFSLMELMIVVVIIGILGAIAMPMYQGYTRRAHFAEVVYATAPYKLAVGECYQLYGSLTDCNAGEHGIPPAISSGESDTLVNTLQVAAGVITATPKNEQGFTANDSYVLTPQVSTQHLSWHASGGAVSAGYAK